MMTVAPEAALAEPCMHGSAWTTNFATFGDGDLRRVLERVGDRGFTTSGTTGQPVTWLRDPQQLVREAEATVGVLGCGHDGIFSTVPQESLYGYAALLVAAKLRLPYRYDRWGSRRLTVAGHNPLIFAIPTAWPMLAQTLPEHFTGAASTGARSALVVHAGALLPQRGVELVHALRGAGHEISGIELFGASETGVVASRPCSTTRETSWAVVADTDILPNDQSDKYGYQGGDPVHLLTVSGPRVGRRAGKRPATSVATGDLVAGASAGQFHVVGRAGRRIKPGGRWVDLDHLDKQLQELLLGREFLTMPIDHPLWGEHVELVVGVQPGENVDELHLRLRQHSNTIDVVPIRVRADARLTRSPMGKFRLGSAGPNSYPDFVA